MGRDAKPEMIKKPLLIVCFSSLVFFLVTSLGRDQPIQRIDLIGRWEEVGNDNLNSASSADSILTLNDDGQFYVVKLTVSEKGPVWSGRGKWRFEDLNTPSGRAMINIYAKPDGDRFIDCWIGVERGMFNDRLIWKFNRNPILKAKYVKMK